MGKPTLLAVAATTSLGAAHAEPPTVDGLGFVARSEASVDLVDDRPGEDTVEAWTRLVASADGHAGDGRWMLEVRGEHFAAWGRPDEGGDLEGAWAIEAGESGWDGRLGGPVRLRAGYLVERWGKLDLLPVVDVLSPRDFRAGPLVPPESMRLPVPLARLQVGADRARAQLTVVPFAGADRVSLLGTDWSVLRQGVVEDLAADAATWPGDPLTEAFLQQTIDALGDTLADLDPATRRGLDAALTGQSLPEALPANAEVALRLEAEPPRVDVALMGGLLRSHAQQTSLDPALAGLLAARRLPTLVELDDLLAGGGGVPLGATWPRTWMAGAEAGSTLGPVGIRAESAWLSDRVVQQPWLASTTSPSIAAGLGLDWSHGSTVALSAEGRWEHLLDPPDSILLTRADRVELAAVARFALLTDRLGLALAGAYDLTFAEYLVRPTASWRISDPLELTVGAVWLGGSEPPPKDFVEAVTWSGGPLGYWGDNDCATLALAWIR